MKEEMKAWHYCLFASLGSLNQYPSPSLILLTQNIGERVVPQKYFTKAPVSFNWVKFLQLFYNCFVFISLHWTVVNVLPKFLTLGFPKILQPVTTTIVLDIACACHILLPMWNSTVVSVIPVCLSRLCENCMNWPVCLCLHKQIFLCIA